MMITKNFSKHALQMSVVFGIALVTNAHLVLIFVAVMLVEAYNAIAERYER